MVRNPFSEVDSPRVNLIDAVLDLIADPNSNQPIVIQGIAGAGKSSFTLRLTSELIDAGFSPIRVQLRDLDVERSILETLPRAIRFSDQQYKPYGWDPQFDGDWFTKLTQSNEHVLFGQGGMCVSPYVLIFDGWDEISTGATQGFKDDIDRVLTEIRSHFIDLRENRPPIRVIVTGRPTVDVTKTRLLRGETPILTIRPFDPSQLEKFIHQVVDVSWSRPLEESTPTGDHNANASAPRSPDGPSEKWFVDVIDTYRRGFESMTELHRGGDASAQPTGSMAVLGMPLLAHIAVRLMLDLSSADQLRALIKTPTTLYRALVDLTYEKGAKHLSAEIGLSHRHRITGEDLRVLSWNSRSDNSNRQRGGLAGGVETPAAVE